jgi:hypothetical protein
LAFPAASASSTFTRIPPPNWIGTATTAARSTYGTGSGTRPVTVTAPSDAFRTSGGGLSPTMWSVADK